MYVVVVEGEFDMPYPAGAILKRRMGSGDYHHYGIASEFYHPESRKQMVYQFGGPYQGDPGDMSPGLKVLNLVWPTKGKGAYTGVHVGLTPYPMFSGGRRVYVERVPEDPVPVLIRAREMMKTSRMKYNPIVNNCEHFARFALDGTWESSQAESMIEKAVQAAGLLLISGFLSK